LDDFHKTSKEKHKRFVMCQRLPLNCTVTNTIRRPLSWPNFMKIQVKPNGAKCYKTFWDVIYTLGQCYKTFFDRNCP
jgi:hypothetical protein